MFLERPVRWLRWLSPTAMWRGDHNEKSIYLTFDDGPIPQATPFILDTLAKYGVKATFFVVGDNVRKFPDLFERIISEGHKVGNHTYHHISGYKHSINTYLNDVKKADEYVHSHLFRPPYGWMKPEQRIWITQHYKIIMWDVITRDYSKRMRPDDVVNNVKRYTRNGSIITFHDSKRSIQNLHTALPESIEWLIREGYKFRTIE
ncbi:MAG: polysaccharide deacetylase family protein [Prevotella sp.]|nr:polysaccharide deacetylase family protein [Candidatus Equicola stercoris]